MNTVFQILFPPHISNPLDVASDSRLKRLGVRANNLTNLLSILEEEEGRHSPHTELLCNLGDLIDVDLDELGGGEGLAEFGDLGRNGFAGTAPGGEAVEDDQGVLGREDFFPGSLAVKQKLG